MDHLNPTLVDGLWPWRQHLHEAAMVVSTLVPEETVTVAKELARDLAGPDRAVVLTGVGAGEPLFWHVPAGRRLDNVAPDLVLLLVHKHFTASARLLLATASRVVLIVGSGPEDRAAALKIMHLIVQDASPSHVEVVVVADGLRTAREVGGDVMSMARNRFGDRTSWRHVPARRIQHVTRSQEEGRMASTRPRPVPLSEAELRAQEWEASFRRAESLLREAQDTLRRQLERTAQPVRAAPPDAAPNGRAERA